MIFRILIIVLIITIITVITKFEGKIRKRFQRRGAQPRTRLLCLGNSVAADGAGVAADGAGAAVGVACCFVLVAAVGAGVAVGVACCFCKGNKMCKRGLGGSRGLKP